MQGLRYTFRAIRKNPVYSVVSIVVLAIAIGANATVFSVLNAFLLRPLPYPDSDRLVMVYDSYPKLGLENVGTAIPDYIERREQSTSLEDLAILESTARTLGGEGDPERVNVARSSPSLFSVLRVAPSLGRLFNDAEATIGNDRVALLSHRVWSSRFGARNDVLDREIRLDGESFRVIGVLPEGFDFAGGEVGVWVPFAFTPEQTSNASRGWQFSVSVGRLRPGATLEGLNAELDAIVRRNVEIGNFAQAGIDATGFTGRAQFLRDVRVADVRSMVLVLQATVFAVLLIACANVASLQLARIVTRRKELAVRAALGAGASRLMRLVLLESLTLALVGAIAGIALAAMGLELVRALGLERPAEGFTFELDLRVLGFTLGAAAFAALVSGLPPVIALLRDDLTRAVHEAGRLSAGGRGTHALRSALVVAQIGMSVALLVGAGLLTRSFLALQLEGPGFNAGSLWTAGIALPRSRYADRESWARFHEQALERLRALPGVSAAGFTHVLPFSGDDDQGSMVVDGYALPEGVGPPHANSRSISEDYLPAIGVPIVMGRNFAASESGLVAIVDENAAAQYWPDGNVLGKRIRHNVDPPDRWYTVIGVVPAVKQGSLAEEATKETIYWHYRQRPQSNGAYALRTTLPPVQLTRVAGAAIAELDPELILFDAQSMDARIESSLGPQRTPMVLTLVFAAVAFTLAVIGVYGVLNWAVTQRHGEIGVRVALGAQVRDIVRMVLQQGGRLIGAGVGIGVLGALALGAALAAQIPNVSAIDPAVLATAVAGLAGAALVASWIPARRASRIDPMRALREE
jgi:putative ABC transport system permease protein